MSKVYIAPSDIYIKSLYNLFFIKKLAERF